MLIGTLAIQCTTPTGETGDFLFKQVEGVEVCKSEILTPVFPGLLELYAYLHANGWTAKVNERQYFLAQYAKE